MTDAYPDGIACVAGRVMVRQQRIEQQAAHAAGENEGGYQQADDYVTHRATVPLRVAAEFAGTSVRMTALGDANERAY
jgi:hypothetical protein